MRIDKTGWNLVNQIKNLKSLEGELDKYQTIPTLEYFFFSSVLEQSLKKMIQVRLVQIEEVVENEELKFRSEIYYENNVKKAHQSKLLKELKYFSKDENFYKTAKELLSERNDIAHHLLDSDIKHLDEIIEEKMPKLKSAIKKINEWSAKQHIDLFLKSVDEKI